MATIQTFDSAFSMRFVERNIFEKLSPGGRSLAPKTVSGTQLLHQKKLRNS